MAPPHFQGSVGGGKSCAQRTSLMLPKKPSKLGFLQHSHPLRDITGYHPNYFLLGFRATASIPTSKKDRLLEKINVKAQAVRAPGVCGASRGLRTLWGLRGLRALGCPGPSGIRPRKQTSRTKLLLQKPFLHQAPTCRFAAARGLVCWVWGIPFKGKINVHCTYLAYWGGWRQGCASRCTGRARRGSIRPFYIGSSHCLTQYGCIG